MSLTTATTQQHLSDLLPADLTPCDRKPIHNPGQVQSFGCLISVSSGWIINHVSANVAEMLGFTPEAALGRAFAEFFPQETVHGLRSQMQTLSRDLGAARVYGFDVMGDGRQFDASIQICGRSYIFEFEPRYETERRNEMAMVQPLLSRIKRAATMEAMMLDAARGMKILSGFDRVMVYQFAQDHSGTVVAEACERDMPAFLGLRFPASDIPAQARALYLRAMMRLIADVDAPVSPILPPLNMAGEPLDLSLAVTRAVSPVHLEYLRNMDVQAAMTVSIIKDGVLWGLFACHHRSARYVDFERRSAIELFAQLFTYELARKQDAVVNAEIARARQVHDDLMIRLSGAHSLHADLGLFAEEISATVACDGFAISIDGTYSASGSALTEAEFSELARGLNMANTNQPFASDCLTKLYPPAEAFADRVAGILAVPISGRPRDCILFFRKEIARQVLWAGEPAKAVQASEAGTRIAPRQSFAAWQEILRNSSAPWSSADLRIAESLRLSLLEILLKLSDQTNAQRKQASEKQELLIAELNHRLRNILGLVRGLVSQSRSGAEDVSSYAEVLDGRIHALARAHDQLTRQQWDYASLPDIIQTEISPYLAGQVERLKITGDNPLLSPTAFSTMALVFHELITNSAKYGALSQDKGQVAVALDILPDGSLAIAWREKGGPVVKVPTRRGFGSTILERAVPFELKGSADLRFDPAGVEVDLRVPAQHVKASRLPAQPRIAASPMPVAAKGMLDVEALVVDDNVIIALDVADILSQAGARRVHLEASAEAALRTLTTQDIGFALLDVNLGSQTSVSVALELRRRGIAFVLATGYGEGRETSLGYPAAPVLQKPYTTEMLHQAIARALADAAGSGQPEAGEPDQIRRV